MACASEIAGDGVPVVEGIDELRGDLGVGAREEIIPLAEQPGTQLLIVFDDAVMHQRELFGGVGVGVYVGGLPVGGPAGVPDAPQPPPARDALPSAGRPGFAGGPSP